MPNPVAAVTVSSLFLQGPRGGSLCPGHALLLAGGLLMWVADAPGRDGNFTVVVVASAGTHARTHQSFHST